MHSKLNILAGRGTRALVAIEPRLTRRQHKTKAKALFFLWRDPTVGCTPGLCFRAAASLAPSLVAKQVVEELRPWIEREKAEHIRRAVTMGKRGYERIDRMWNENPLVEVKDESLAAATLEKHDTIIRRNLGMNETGDGSGTLSLNVLSGRGGRTRIAIEQEPNRTPAQDQS